MTTDDAMHALRTAIRTELIAEVRAYRATLHPAANDQDATPGAMDALYIEGVDDAIQCLEAA